MGSELFYHRKIENSRGFTITEILVVLALAGVVMLGNFTFMAEFMENMRRVEKDSFDDIETALTSRRFTKIISTSTPSFNRLEVLDSKGKNFYDYYPDMPREFFPEENRSRSFVFSLGGGQKFYLLFSEENKYPGISLDPMHAYKEVSTPSNMNLDGTVEYTGLNSAPAIAGGGRLMTKVFGNRWQNGALFVVSSPVYLRPVNPSTATVDLNQVPRMPSFTGQVSQYDLISLTSAGVKIMNVQPWTGLAYTSMDNYFRTLPSVGGAAPFVKVEAVQLARLEFKPSVKPGLGNLVLSRWTGGKFVEEDIVIREAKVIRLIRESVTVPLITLEVEQ